MESWRANQDDRPEQSRWRAVAGTIGGVLLITLIVGAIVIASQHSRQKQEAAAWKSEMQQLQEARSELSGELVTLEGEYEEQISENSELKATLQAKLDEVEALDKRVRSAQSQLARSKANSEEIKGRLAQLEELKMELEKDVARLTGENTALTETNTVLTATVASTKEEVEQLTKRVMHLTDVNSQLNKRLATIAPAGFTADHFAISATRRNDKLTSKASRADVINVSFNLSDVPQDYAGSHELYLVMTDFEGLPVKKIPLSSATVRTSDNVMNIQCADKKKVKVSNDQQVVMTISPEEDLDPGSYNVVVYADNGFLGATGFQLR